MKLPRQTLPAYAVIAALLIWLVPAAAQELPQDRPGTALGDWGHFISFAPIIYLNNPSGTAFDVALHQQGWVMLSGWTKDELPVRVAGPDGANVFNESLKFKDTSARFRVPAGGKGVYRLEPGLQASGRVDGANIWLESTLSQSVVMAAVPPPGAVAPANGERRPLYTQCSVPRRWWFWVPADCREFTWQATRFARHMSQREDWGISIFSPRGQRLSVLWGQPQVFPKREKYQGSMTAKIQVEPGSAGRFWYVEVRLGDSHNYSNVNLALEGVPPYLARSPEEWFNPETGKAAPVSPYDESRFMQAAPAPDSLFQHWSPCPALGDPDGNFVRGDGSFAIWNPADRELRYVIGDYLPRRGRQRLPVANVVVTGADGRAILNERVETPHFHGHGKTLPLPRTGKGVATVSVAGVEHWLAFTYPATPLVLIGTKQPGDWRRFDLEVGSARNYYFYVPAGCRGFELRAAAEDATDVIDLEVNAPDRTVAKLYARDGGCKVEVPAGLDGKIWHLRLDIGGASRLITKGGKGNYRYLGINVKLELKGVPGLLSPTWEQWFDPARPRPPLERR